MFNYINLISKINILMMQGFKLKHHALVAGSQQPLLTPSPSLHVSEYCLMRATKPRCHQPAVSRRSGRVYVTKLLVSSVVAAERCGEPV